MTVFATFSVCKMNPAKINWSNFYNRPEGVIHRSYSHSFAYMYMNMDTITPQIGIWNADVSAMFTSTFQIAGY